MTAWIEAFEKERERERLLDTALKCLRKLRVEFARYEELAKGSAFVDWLEETERQRERERDLDVRLRLLTGRFGHAARAAGKAKLCSVSLQG